LDGIFIQTAHPEYSRLNYSASSKLKFIFDGRNMIDTGPSLSNEIVYMNIENI
jgi:hypothetical protein